MSEINEQKSKQTLKALNRDQLLTIGDLDDFKRELFLEMKSCLGGNSGENQKQWLRSRDVRQFLGVSTGTLQNLRITGVLPYSKIGKIIMYKYSDIVAVLESNNSTSA